MRKNKLLRQMNRAQRPTPVAAPLDDFGRFRLRFVDQFDPQGPIENELFDQFVSTLFQLHRIHESERTLGASPDPASLKHLLSLARYRRSLELTRDSTLRLLTAVQHERITRHIREPEHKLTLPPAVRTAGLRTGSGYVFPLDLNRFFDKNDNPTPARPKLVHTPIDEPGNPSFDEDGNPAPARPTIVRAPIDDLDISQLLPPAPPPRGPRESPGG